MNAPHRMTMSGEDYLAWEEGQERKHELVRGVVRLTTGASVAHNIIAGNAFGLLLAMLRGKPCRAFTSDLKVRTGDDSYRYPDVTVDCGAPNPRDLFADQPTVLIEVISPATDWFDETDRLAEYQALPSVRHIILFARLWTRTEEGWASANAEGLDAALPLPAIGATLAMAEVYEGVDFEAVTPDL